MAAPKQEPKRYTLTELEAIANELHGEGGVAIKNRTAFFKTYPSCFVGSAAVQWLVQKGKGDVEGALNIGKQLIEADLMHHVGDSKGFLNEDEWYRFRQDETYDGNSYYGQAKVGLKSGALQLKKTGALSSGWGEKWVVITATEPAQWLQYDSQYDSKPSKSFSLKQAGLNVAECEDCKENWHCFTLSGGDNHMHEVYCAHHSRDQQAWMDLLIAKGATLQRENLSATAESLYEFNAARPDGTVVPFSQYAGQVVMVVNVASY
jgi:hypothetical protein